MKNIFKNEICMNNISNPEMQSFPFLMQNAQCILLRKEKEVNKNVISSFSFEIISI
jgi:hypothetical protein